MELGHRSLFGQERARASEPGRRRALQIAVEPTYAPKPQPLTVGGLAVNRM